MIFCIAIFIFFCCIYGQILHDICQFNEFCFAFFRFFSVLILLVLPQRFASFSFFIFHLFLFKQRVINLFWNDGIFRLAQSVSMCTNMQSYFVVTVGSVILSSQSSLLNMYLKMRGTEQKLRTHSRKLVTLNAPSSLQRIPKSSKT